jgi:mannosyltransferase OCH1-like enzyme
LFIDLTKGPVRLREVVNEEEAYVVRYKSELLQFLLNNINIKNFRYKSKYPTLKTCGWDLYELVATPHPT